MGKSQTCSSNPNQSFACRVTVLGVCCYARLVMLLGRLAELEACQKALSSQAGGSAAAAVITGPPGIGKTSCGGR